jgi:integrase
VNGVREARWAHLLEEDPAFRRWYDNLARSSAGTARERARVLYRFLRHHDLTPAGLAEMGKRDVGAVEDLLMDFVSELRREGKAPGYIKCYLTAVSSWLEFNGVRLVRRIKVGNMNHTPTIEDERVPTPDELLQVLSYADERGRCSISLMAFAGLRPGVLGSMTGTDGLEARDLPEMVIEGGRVTFSRTPTMVVVRPDLSKAGHRYFTFLASEGCEYLRAYLERRLAMGEGLGPGSAVITAKPGHTETGFRVNGIDGSGHVSTKSVTGEVRKAMRPRYKWRPYVLRAYFDTQLLIAENHGKVSHAYRQFFMGHKGDIEARYTTNKGRLSEEMIEDMRQRVVDSEEYLTTRKTRDEAEVRKRQFLLTAEMLFPDRVESIRNILARHVSLEEASPEIRDLVTPTGKGRREALVVESEAEMVEFVSQGWELMKNLNNGKFFLVRN